MLYNPTAATATATASAPSTTRPPAWHDYHTHPVRHTGYFQPRHRRHRVEPGDEERSPLGLGHESSVIVAPAVPTCVDAVEFGASKEYESLKQP